MITSSTSEATILPNATPMIIPTARSTTLPLTANSRNSFSMAPMIPCLAPQSHVLPRRRRPAMALGNRQFQMPVFEAENHTFVVGFQLSREFRRYDGFRGRPWMPTAEPRSRAHPRASVAARLTKLRSASSSPSSQAARPSCW